MRFAAAKPRRRAAGRPEAVGSASQDGFGSSPRWCGKSVIADELPRNGGLSRWAGAARAAAFCTLPDLGRARRRTAVRRCETGRRKT